MAFITVEHVSKTYHSGASASEPVKVFADLSFHVDQGEFVTLFGPNGCGKTTLMNLVAGITPPDGGAITVDETSPEVSFCGYVFQDYVASLLPWRTALSNITLPLEAVGVPQETRQEKARELLELLDLYLPLDRFPYQLSGGQQQAVAIARALVGSPRVLLMDEPFNQLDYHSRTTLSDKLLAFWQKTNMTVLFVSHDLEEAVSLGDRVLFLGHGAAGVVNEIETDLPSDRDHSVITSAHFRELLAEALLVVEEEARS